MICIDDATYHNAMKVLREVQTIHPDARMAANNLLRAGIEAETRNLDFDEAPALCRRQAD